MEALNSSLSNQSSETLVFSRKIGILILVPYVVSLVFALMRRNKGNFLFLGFPDHLIKQSCGSSFRFPFRVSVDVHCGTYVSVSKQFLHILWCCTIGEQITGECVSQHMKMEIFKSFQLLFCRPCHNTNCTR